MRGFLLRLCAVALFSASIMSNAYSADWYVKATAKGDGDGSKAQPFNSLAAAETASGVGDSIFVLHAPSEALPLDGGIVLKDGQRLIGTGPNPTLASPSAAMAKITNSAGNAVLLANDNVVENLHIDSAGYDAILGLNVTGAAVRKVLVTEANTLSGFTADDCDTVNLTSVLGCGPFQFVGAPSPFSAIVFSNDDNGPAVVSHRVSDTIVSGVNGGGIGQVIAGHATATLVIEDTHIEDTRFQGPGMFAGAYQQGQITLNVNRVSTERTSNDGMVLFTGFFGSGVVAPASDSIIRANIDGYRFTGTGEVNPLSSQTGIEVYIVDYDAGEVHVKMRNSDMTEGWVTGIQFAAQGLGFVPSLRDYTFDFGCIDVDNPTTEAVETCEDFGYESTPGNNRVFDNGKGVWGETVDVQVLGPSTAIGQGNWWGSAAGLAECLVFPDLGPCTLFDGGTGVGSFDARFQLTEDPRP